jgi:hypothetical protein
MSEDHTGLAGIFDVDLQWTAESSVAAILRAVRRLIVAFAMCLSATALVAESAAGLHWTAPVGWKAGPPQMMRAATYAVAAASGDTASSECVVYFFGAGQGGSVDANIERWKGQFTNAGKPAAAAVSKRTARGIPMTTIDVAGEYSGLGGPMAASKPVAGYRLLGAIVEGPGGNIFVKFTGPAKTIAANKAKYDALLASFAKDE